MSETDTTETETGVAQGDSRNDNDHPEPPEPDYPPAPKVQNVEITASTFENPRKIRVTIEYWTHRGAGKPYTAEVKFRVVDNSTAELRDVEGAGRLIDQITAVITACERVENHPAIESVNGLNQISGQAMQYIGKCEDGE